MEQPSLTRDLIARLIELVRTGILVLDKEGTIRFANDCAASIFGHTRQELTGVPIRTLFLPDDHEIFLANIMRVTLHGKGFEGEALLIRKNREKIFVNLSTSLYHENSEDRDLLIFTVQDISKLKSIEKDYVDSERFAGLGRLTDQIAHQIRNPIVSIGGFALRLARQSLENDDYSNYVNIILSETERLNYLISRLVEFTHVHSLSYAPVTLGAVFDETLKSARSLPGYDNISVRCPSPEQLCPDPFHADCRLLVKALHSIIQNAVENLPGGVVHLTGSVVGEQVTLLVEDEGEGIAAQYLPFVFDPFFSTKFDHLGLGLTMAKRIVREHRGQIAVTIRPKGGTRVEISIPKDRRRTIRTRHLNLEIVNE